MNNDKTTATKFCIASFLLAIPLAVVLMDFLYPQASIYSYGLILLSPVIIAACSYILYLVIQSSTKILWSIYPVTSSVIFGLSIYALYVFLTFSYLSSFEEIFSISSISGVTGTFIMLYGWFLIFLGIVYRLINRQ